MHRVRAAAPRLHAGEPAKHALISIATIDRFTLESGDFFIDAGV